MPTIGAPVRIERMGIAASGRFTETPLHAVSGDPFEEVWLPEIAQQTLFLSRALRIGPRAGNKGLGGGPVARRPPARRPP